MNRVSSSSTFVDGVNSVCDGVKERRAEIPKRTLQIPVVCVYTPVCVSSHLTHTPLDVVSTQTALNHVMIAISHALWKWTHGCVFTPAISSVPYALELIISLEYAPELRDVLNMAYL